LRSSARERAGAPSARIPRPARIPCALTKEPRSLLSRTSAHSWGTRPLWGWRQAQRGWQAPLCSTGNSAGQLPPGMCGTGPRSGPPEFIMVLGGVVGGEVVGGVVGGVVVVVLGGAGVVRPSPPGDDVGREGSASQALPSLSSSRLEGSVWSLSYHNWASS
jgi:hypothetical protein